MMVPCVLNVSVTGQACFPHPGAEDGCENVGSTSTEKAKLKNETFLSDKIKKHKNETVVFTPIELIQEKKTIAEWLLYSGKRYQVYGYLIRKLNFMSLSCRR